MAHKDPYCSHWQEHQYREQRVKIKMSVLAGQYHVMNPLKNLRRASSDEFGYGQRMRNAHHVLCVKIRLMKVSVFGGILIVYAPAMSVLVKFCDGILNASSNCSRSL